ncbi:MAG: 3-deoxy-D-manno-octulosonic acid transferase [Bacteroidaceae bacterium]|nr:3-deoxy-D-manno-octulosonic acid transferase [Bacteroidaceae bacterium]
MLAVGLVSLFNKRALMLGRGHMNAFKTLKKQFKPTDEYVWVHAASLGEFEQGRPLMERLKREHPELKILLTFFSPSGYEVRKDWEGADIVCYLPFDTPAQVHLFFHYFKPKMLILIKYEFWQNYLKACKKRGIPVYSVSSIFRPNQIFFRWYGRAGYNKVLNKVTHFFVQNEQSRELLASLGYDNVTVVGDTRFDRVIDIRKAAKPLPLVEAFAANHRVFVAGSSWPGDEALFIPWFKRQQGMKLIIAPHIIDESHLHEIETALVGKKVLRYTDATPDNVAEADVLIVNCFGLLSSIYRYGQVAMVGGGFGHGIHNVPEAAVYGMPVIIGPNNNNFREARHLIDVGACFEVHDSTEFDAIADRLYSDHEFLQHAGEEAGSYIHGNAGATDIIYKHIFDI